MSSSSSSLHMFQLVFMFSFSVLLLMSTMQTISAATTNKTSIKTYKKFVKSACNSTTYPKVCNKVLIPYASTIKTDPQKLSYIALSITLKATYNASSSIKSVSKMKGLSPYEKEIISDCAETTAEAIDELNDSLKKMADMQGSDRNKAHMDDIRTWVSAALTDNYTCTDDFEGQKVHKALKNIIKKSVLYIAKLTSNCLSLFNLIDH
ncbi:hypothetical protein PTKIN_Ptkin04bG0003500 [Pterospermum kingtungense]